ncbi:MAG: hypothetical protein ACM3US_01280 [Sphingomonadaceae bacterium]
MRLSEIDAEQRKRLLADPDNFPLRVAFLGKVGILTFEEVSFLLRSGVDPDFDRGQVEQVLGEPVRPALEVGAEAEITTPRVVEAVVPPPPRRETYRLPSGTIALLAGAAGVLLRLVRRLLRL